MKNFNSPKNRSDKSNDNINKKSIKIDIKGKANNKNQD